jgi:hypothetical protein
MIEVLYRTIFDVWCRDPEYTDEKKVTRQTVELVAQTILRIDYTKLGVAEQGDAAEAEE